MARPLLVTDCDEVLLHMVVPFRQWLDEEHHIHFDLSSGEFTRALRHKLTGEVVADELIWPLLSAFFETEMHRQQPRSEEHTSELQSLMRISYAVFCLKQKTTNTVQTLQA